MTRNQLRLLQKQRARRQRRVRAELHGTAERPRLSVYRSNKSVYIQAINDDAGATIAASSDAKQTGTKTERAIATARVVAAALKKAGVSKLTFDRGHYRYHGRVQALADTLREEGMEL